MDRQKFEQTEKGVDCTFTQLPDELQARLNQIVERARHVSELVAEVDAELRAFYQLPEGEYPKQTDAVVRYWKFCMEAA